MNNNPESVAATVGRSGQPRTREGSQLLIISALTIALSACALPADRAVRAYDACITRHPQDVVVCEGPRQAYEVGTSTYQSEAAAIGPTGGSAHQKHSVAAGQ
jgi:hypothetical protein